MAASDELDDANQQMTYTFRFSTTKKIINVTEEELNCIPHLLALVTHNNDFSSIQNEDGEYVLDTRIRYNWFMPIFQAATTKHPSALFTELSKESYVWGMLQLYDYLCLNSIAVPLLKDQNLIRTKSDNIDEKKFRVEYCRAKNLLEVRDTAAQFIFSLSNNEYDFDDSSTLRKIFSLIMIIVSDPNAFDIQLCHHMMTITKKVCFSLFSSTQQHELKMAEKYISNLKTHSFMHMRNVHRTLSTHFQNVFAWKGTYVPIKEDNSVDRQSISTQQSTTSENRFQYNWWIPRFNYLEFNLIDYPERELHIQQVLDANRFLQDLNINEQEQTKMEAKSARLGYFNTLPKRPKVDKFKHRCGPKTQKHR